MLLFLIALSKVKVIALPTIPIRRDIIKWEAMLKRIHELLYKTNTKNETKRLRATAFAFCYHEVGRAIDKQEAIEKS